MATLNNTIINGVLRVNGAQTNSGNITASAFYGVGTNLTALSASNISSGTLSADRLATSGATAGSYGLSADATPAFGGSFNVPYITVDNKGRVTSISAKTVTIPSSTATTSAAGLMSASDKTLLNNLGSLYGDDADSTVNKIQEVLAIFSDWTEGTNVISYLSTNYTKRPTTCTSNAIAKWSSTAGTLLNSGVTIDGSNNIAGAANIGATTFNSLTLTKQTTGFTISGGTTSKTLTVADTTDIHAAVSVSGALSVSAQTNITAQTVIIGQTSISQPLTVSETTTINKGLTVGDSTHTGKVKITSDGTSDVTTQLRSGTVAIVGSANTFTDANTFSGNVVMKNLYLGYTNTTTVSTDATTVYLHSKIYDYESSLGDSANKTTTHENYVLTQNSNGFPIWKNAAATHNHNCLTSNGDTVSWIGEDGTTTGGTFSNNAGSMNIVGYAALCLYKGSTSSGTGIVLGDGSIELNTPSSSGDVNINGNVLATSLAISGGSASAFLKANGSVDNTDYQPVSTAVTHTADTAVGGTTTPVYIDADGKATALSYTIAKSVPSDAVFTDTNTKVTAVGNHYTPSGGTSLTATTSGTATRGSTVVLTGITKDAAGHVTGVTGYTLPASDNVDTKNTAGSTDTSSKIFLVGATSQTASSQTYSDNEVYTTSGVLTTKAVQVGGSSGATIQYNSSTGCIEILC